MATMDHINVVRLYSVCMGKQMMLISQFVRLGSLLSFLKKNQATLDAYTMLNFSKQIADVSVLISDGLMVLHNALDWKCVVDKNSSRLKTSNVYVILLAILVNGGSVKSFDNDVMYVHMTLELVVRAYETSPRVIRYNRQAA